MIHKDREILSPKLFHNCSQILGHCSQHVSSGSSQFCKELILAVTLSRAELSVILPVYWSRIGFMTPTFTKWTCKFGPLLNASLRLFLEMVFCIFVGSQSCSEHVWEEHFSVLGLWIWPECE